ncbi:DUF302 domain-containing protein [Gordonia sp. (in: high G+C Gram-positive bacteria)]|jgi:uncharacterized protein (DUF302 family)|uniref:DUF302 domain-containing protein n=1 Tax=Gordonia sp. (in: high G+C Gram-positive bacteria) TaxID=84139 RepID=UPI001DD52A3E|nr:DUF302 domain-containing protein [Gordonia sp. (in: high G+C Gram-positive bacteria)]MCB1294959.1 DUF302 domain-containing protein [Gordonia sp. (in: high G+C Gram-positive bacteria)]HMS75427.1 DUF302 domain-containing protein [Gordonia sp. (in: high G+C Gram-positive bacteria)]HQV17294.1 DUF302 domain-containing protein [Gordonia sp. (in: high G+C Gram-positive bacteria)]
MTAFTLARTLDLPYAQAVTQVRDGLAGVGFGVLTEIDIAATLKTKLDVDVAPKIILGACRPQLAHQALQADPRVATLLPCNVVVSADGDGSLVEIMDPGVMPAFTGTAELEVVATEARTLLASMLDNLQGVTA